MIGQIRLFLCAMQFLTRLPTPRLDGFEPDWINRSARYFPVVGWVVGAICATAWLLASRVWPGLPAAILAAGVGVLVTGGFHEDGLADAADGLGGGQTALRRLEIMKDSRLGSYGALALWSVLTLKVAALASFDPVRGALALVLVHGAARSAPVVVMWAAPYAGDPDQAKWRPGQVQWWEAAIAVAFGLCPLPLLLGPAPALIGIGLAAGAGLAMALTARRLIGGFTGDVLGAVEQVAELGLILGLAVR